MRYLYILGIITVLLQPFASIAQKPSLPEQKQIKAALRRAGHEILLATGDSTSRIMPIKEESGLYRVDFETPFAFDPGTLSAIVNKELSRSGFSTDYVLEVEDCASEEVVYSYEILFQAQEDIIPCSGRMQEQSCYSLLLSFSEPEIIEPQSANAEGESWSAWLWLALLLLPVIYLYKRRRKPKSLADANLLDLGEYQFRPQRNELIFKGNSLELTSKESELLWVLYRSRNETLKREVLLEKVWGDEGDYVGRTLDVFVSKLRKKLEQDPQVKIQNVRGVGYKLVA